MARFNVLHADGLLDVATVENLLDKHYNQRLRRPDNDRFGC